MKAYIAWPAQTMPYEVFRGPWSVQLSDAYKIGNNVIQVTMTDLGTGEEWIFHSNNTYDTSKTPYFNVLYNCHIDFYISTFHLTVAPIHHCHLKNRLPKKRTLLYIQFPPHFHFNKYDHTRWL